jgi:8-amino-7-oxononanoate synthase
MAHTLAHPPASAGLLEELAAELARADAAHLRRRVRVVDGIEGAVVRLGPRRLVCWCSNDYLGLSAHPAVVQAAAAAAAGFGVGARASRLLAGTTRWHAALEAGLAAWYGTEAAAAFASGYLANLGALGVLAGPDDAIYADRLSHASLLDACRATRARLRVFRHNEAGHLDALLARAPRVRRLWVVTEGIFSMDGDASPLRDLVDVAQARGASVYVDDAHGAFVAGPTGRGSVEAAGVAAGDVIYMATLGKALGSQGGFVVGPQPLIDAIQQRARPFLYATALAVPSAAAAGQALEVLVREPHWRTRLGNLVQALDAALRAAGVPLRELPPSHIVPIVLGDSARALAVSAQLEAFGIWAPAVRPPTVPRGQARLRLSVTALHTEEQIDALALALREALAG